MAIIFQFIELRSIQSITASLQAIPTMVNEQQAELPISIRQDSPYVQLAYANALSTDNQFDRAEAAYTQLIQRTDDWQIAASAHYNLANAYLRQGMVTDSADNQSQTMLALAKQRYRDLLKSTPNDWDARYNLERALRLSPEGDSSNDDDRIEPLKRVRVIVPGFEKQDLP